MSLIIFIFILGLLIFVHELGHFATAKFFGIRVDEFGMGFPPRAIKLFERNGTEYTLNWIPFGGFVKIHGEDSVTKDDPDYNRSFVAKKWWQQIIVLVAGVTMNVVLAWVLFSGASMMGTLTPESMVDNPSDLKNVALTVLDVSPNSPAERAGIKSGDVVERIATSTAIITNASRDTFIQAVRQVPENESITLTITRGLETTDIVVKPTNGIVSEGKAIGISIDRVGVYREGFFKSLGSGVKTTWVMLKNTTHAFGQLFAGKADVKSITGPVGLVSVVGEARHIGFTYVMMLAGIISINLAIINMVPFPALDGGRVLFVIIEQVIRRPLPQKFVQWANGIGFLLLIALMLVITIKDVVKLF